VRGPCVANPVGKLISLLGEANVMVTLLRSWEEAAACPLGFCSLPFHVISWVRGVWIRLIIFMLSGAWTIGDSCPGQLGCVNRLAANVGQLGALDTSSATCLACTTGVPLTHTHEHCTHYVAQIHM
jgi:hypothetical protein